MAFVKIEDKTTESEVIVFPNLFEQVGSQLIQDAVIRATGKVNARDREGNVTSEVKMIADEVQIVDDEELRSYESHGQKMMRPKAARKVLATRKKAAAPAEATQPAASASYTVVTAETLKKLFLHVKNPDDQKALIEVKRLCALHPGIADVVLVLGADKKSAIKMPFRVDTNDELVGALVKILGEDAVVLS